MTVVAIICLSMLLAAALLTLLYMIRVRNLVDRSIAVDTLVALIVSGLAVVAAWASDGLPVDLALLISLLGFLGAVTVSRFIERKGL